MVNTLKWPESTPESTRISLSRFEELNNQIESDYPHIRSLIVAQQGRRIHEQYFGDSTRDQLHNFASGAKSFTSTLVGILLQQGRITHLRQKLIEFCPATIRHNPAIDEITIEHLLTMSSGLHYGRSPREVNTWLGSDDWLETILTLDVRDTPGKVFTYKPDPFLISHIIASIAKQTPLEFADKHLFKPLGINEIIWPDNGASDGVQLHPRDIAKLGQLYLQNGMWEGQQLVDPAYIQAATSWQIRGVFPENDGYGFLWWVTHVRSHHAYYASGFGGQYLLVVPALAMVVVVTSTMDHPHLDNKHLLKDWLAKLS